MYFERALKLVEQLEQTSLHANAQSRLNAEQENIRQLDQKIREAIIKSRDIVEKAKAVAHKDENLSKYEQTIESLSHIESVFKSHQNHMDQTLAFFSRGQTDQAYEYVKKTTEEEENLTSSLEELLIDIEKFTHDASLATLKYEKDTFTWLLGLLLVNVLAGTGLGILIMRSIINPLNEAVHVAQTIATGDLTGHIAAVGNSELGRLLTAQDTMRGNLREMLELINSSTITLSGAAEELHVTTEQVAQGMQTNRTEVEQLATAMNEMTATVQEIAQNAADTASAAQNADQESNSSVTVVNQTISAIEGLANDITHAGQVINELEKDSENIGAVLDVIKSISEQTNLLALNAAIEAARAGEQGRGFAVVADEVKTLAQRTQESTQEIQDMISRIQSSAQNAVSVITTSSERAGQGVEQARQAGTSLGNIKQVITNISDMNTQIACASEEHSAVAEEINRNVVNINQITEQSADATSQTTAAISDLTRMANDLREQVARFRT